MPRVTSLRVHLTIGMAVAAAAVVPLGAVALGQFARIERDVDALIHRHMRREAFGHRFVVATALARRTSRSFALLGDSIYVARTREHIGVADTAIDSLRVIGADPLAAQCAVLARLFSDTFDSLAALSPRLAVNLTELRSHARGVLNTQRVELDRLLAEAARTGPSASDSLIRRVQASFDALDLDTLFAGMAAGGAKVWSLDARLDTLSRAMIASGEALVSEARVAVERKAIEIAIRVARGERNLLLILVATLGAAAIWARQFPRTLDVPIGRYTRAVWRASGGDLDADPGGCRYRELNELAEALRRLLDFVRRTDELRTEKVRIHWRRLQLLAETSQELWCVCDGAGRPVLMSAPLARRVGDPGAGEFPPAGLAVRHTHHVDPTDPRAGAVLWLEEINTTRS